MGRLGPLTSQALGRSPYDDVAQGTGEDDPRAPPQMYDERGRAINPETKRINKDIVRSHNEVMQVIGVAEPDHPVIDPQTEARIQQDDNENKIGHHLMHLARTCAVAGIWGVNGHRQRIMIYRQYATVPFYELFKFHQRPTQATVGSSGLPVFLLIQRLNWHLYGSNDLLTKKQWFRFLLGYLVLHCEIFVTMQRTDLIASTLWFPPLSYFVPFTSMSLIPPPPPLTSVTSSSLVQWGITFAKGFIPILAHWSCNALWSFTISRLWYGIFGRLPGPTQTAYLRSSHCHLPVQQAISVPEEGSSRPAGDIARNTSSNEGIVAESRSLGGDGEPQTEFTIPIERRNTFSSRGEDDASEDDEPGVVSGLISIDVEATETADTPPGIWSAELRPSQGDSACASDHPVYADNALTRLPQVVAADVLTRVCTYALVLPYETFCVRLIARAIHHRAGLPMDDLQPLNAWNGWTRTSVTSMVGLSLLHLIIDVEYWAFMTGLALLYRGCQPEWTIFQVLAKKLWNKTPETSIVPTSSRFW